MDIEFENEKKALGVRIREARDEAGFSRAALSDAAGIPAKSIERMEAGTMEPSIFRIRTLAEVLDVPLTWLMDGEGERKGDELGPGTAPDEDGASLPDPGEVEPLDEDLDTDVEDALDRLDELRERGFDGAQREAIALTGHVGALLKFLEPNELKELAIDRSVFMEDAPFVKGILDAFSTDVDHAQQCCEQLEERIIDTAVLGVDLFEIDIAALSSLADRLENESNIEIERDGSFFNDETHKGLAPGLRPVLRTLAIMGKSPEFADQEMFPRRGP